MVRRYFTDAIPKGKEYDYISGGAGVILLCLIVSGTQKQNHTVEQRKQFRLEKEKPILEATDWLDQQRSKQVNFCVLKAVNYAQNRKRHPDDLLEDGHCSLSNNP